MSISFRRDRLLRILGFLLLSWSFFLMLVTTAGAAMVIESVLCLVFLGLAAAEGAGWVRSGRYRP